MKGKHYPCEKIKYIVNKPIEEWIAFYNKISNKNKKKWFNRFPPVDGFRKSSPKNYEMRFKQFVKQIKKDIQNDSDDSFPEFFIFHMFHYWLESNTSLFEVLESYDNSDDFQDDTQHIPPNTFLDVSCFSCLRKAENENKINIEDIKLLYEFGYFLKDPLIDCIIDNNVEPDFEKMTIQPQFINTFIKHYITNDPFVNSDDIKKDVNIILDKLLPEQKKRTDKIELMQNELETRTANSNLKKSMSPVNEKMKSIEQRINTLTSTSDDVEIRLLPVKEKIKSIEQMIENLNTTSDDFKTRLAPIIEKIQSLEQIIDNLNTPIMENELETKPEIAKKKLTSTIHLTQFQASENIKVVDSFKSLHQHMVNNFKKIGLINKYAKKLSTEILAGSGAGALITFSGALSFFLAEICARSIAAKNDIQILHIPVGLLDGYQFHKEITHCLNKSLQSDCLTAIIVEGINLSAFECYAQTLRQMITHRLINYQDAHNHVVCFATLSDGPAALPLSKEFCSFGPVFNTDFLGWGAKGITDKIQGGTISTENWNHWRHSCLKIETPNTLQSLLDEMSDISQLWKISIRKACQFLNSKNPLESIGFGWLIPLAMVDHNNQELIFQFCEDDMGKKSDNRVVKLINNIKND